MRALTCIALVVLGLLSVFAACNTAPNHGLFVVGVLSLVLGLKVGPSEEQARARVRLCNLGLKGGGLGPGSGW